MLMLLTYLSVIIRAAPPLQWVAIGTPSWVSEIYCLDIFCYVPVHQPSCMQGELGLMQP